MNGNAMKMHEIKIHNNIVGITASTKHSAYCGDEFAFLRLPIYS